MADTAIEWATRVWNPTTGCDRVSSGCDHCYALTMAKRLKAMEQQRVSAGKLNPADAKYQTDGDPRTSGPGFGLAMHDRVLPLPLTWKTPQRVFVNSMSDLFHPKVSDAFIAEVFAVMARSPRHTYQVLTKRPARMRAVLNRPSFRDNLAHLGLWPLPHLWLGVSVENQDEAARRLGLLFDTPAAVRWVSAEPLLGPVDLAVPVRCADGVYRWPIDYLNWVVVGGESGPGARPMDPTWARSLRDQCVAAGVPFLFKQWGEFEPRCTLALTGVPCSCGGMQRSHPIKMHRTEMARVGKKAAGRELDGRTWDEYPAAVSGA